MTITLYEPAMCCSTGLCGVDVDPLLVTFAADVAWAQQQGIAIRRFNLSQEPLAFANNPVVATVLQEAGAAGLPAILVDGAPPRPCPRRHGPRALRTERTDTNDDGNV